MTAALAVFLAAAACAGAVKNPLVDPFPLRLPLVEAGTLEIDGHVAGQPRARDGILYFATREGYLTAVVVPSRAVLWRKPVENAGRGTGDAPVPPAVSNEPVLTVDGSTLRAVAADGREVWAFSAAGAISAVPVVRDGRAYFGTGERWFCALSSATGKVKWRRRLQGSPLHPAIVFGRRIAVVASNSTLYFLSGGGGSILSWEAIPSRVVYEPARTGTSLLVSPAGDRVLVFDLRTGARIGQHLISGTLAAGAVWSPPYVVLVEEDDDSGRQRLVFLRSR